MNYQRYKNARNMAWQILLDEGICSLPVNVGRLCRSLEISVRQYAGEDSSDGKSLIIDGRPLILVSRNKPVPRQRFTAAHELGHVLLGHVEEGDRLVNRGAGGECVCVPPAGSGLRTLGMRCPL